MSEAVNASDTNLKTSEPSHSDNDRMDAKASGRRSKSNQLKRSKELTMADTLARPGQLRPAIRS